MRFKRIFTKDIDCKLWSTCYPEKGRNKDIFALLFNNWNDPNYLYDFFVEHKAKLDDPFWKGIEIEDAIDQVLEEAFDFETEIRSIQQKLPGYERRSISDLFLPLHKGLHALLPNKKDQTKAKPDTYADSMLRLYAIQLDYAFIVTGGAIKLVKEMRGSYMQPELDNLNRVQKYFKQEGIVSAEGFDDY